MSRSVQSPEDLADGILRGERTALARAITLVESSREADVETADRLFARLDAAAPPFAFRLGITGAPGAGKSTLIEALGMKLCAAGRRVAVLAIDPSSSISGGSLLGDKTRMSALAHHPAAFVRPSPSLGIGGGLGVATADAARLCEAAGFDFVIIETVGVGQGELDVREVADVVMVLVDPGAGDGLQAVKRGLLEVADLIAVTKADGERREEAEKTKSEFEGALQIIPPNSAPRVLLSSTQDESLLAGLLAELAVRETAMAPALAAMRGEQLRLHAAAEVARLAAQWAAKHPVIEEKLASLSRKATVGVRSVARRAWAAAISGMEANTKSAGR